jgi:uncharacterized protein YyaL (SSP411 family)
MPNRLIEEKSPYLLQHAHNPVQWYPWGDEAFNKARDENKPVFLSIGYATCHWCHVMEKESFEDPEAAAALNDAFVCIKVDREERPDIDAVYMTACQMISGNGGWPLNVMLTPDKKPFFAGTYFPKQSRFGRPGIMDVCRQIKAMWQNNPQRIQAAAQGLIGHLEQAFVYPADSGLSLDTAILDTALAQIERSYDPKFGGFDNAPKFPTPHRFMFLLRSYHRTGNAHALEMVSKTLTAMRLGGLWDHVGFGFHRYATDARWLLPHFEKMLYDQALLAIAYLETYQVTRDQFFRQTAEEIFAYVQRDMTDPQGGFYTAEDADSQGEEGKFYVWHQTEFDDIAADEAAQISWSHIFNLQPGGNFSDEATRQTSGTNILHLTRTWEQWARKLGMPEQMLSERWAVLREKLFHTRRQREAPLKDDKILTDWNGLMIAALAVGARVLDSDDYAAQAQRAVDFIQSHLVRDNGSLVHRFRDGQAGISGQAGDYAFLIMGLIELYRSTFRTDLLEWALDLQAKMDADFWDADQGGYFLTATAETELPVRPKEIYDGALPSVNSVALSNLLLLSRLTGDTRWEERAHLLTQAFAASVARQPAVFTHFLNGLDMALEPGQEVVVTGGAQDSDTRVLLNALQSSYAPHLVTHLKSDHNAAHLSRLAAFTAGLSSAGGAATAHICSGFNCKNSTTDVAMMLNQLLPNSQSKEKS